MHQADTYQAIAKRSYTQTSTHKPEHRETVQKKIVHNVVEVHHIAEPQAEEPIVHVETTTIPTHTPVEEVKQLSEPAEVHKPAEEVHHTVVEEAHHEEEKAH